MLPVMAMKPRDLEDAQNIINAMKQGFLSRRDLTALLIYIRECIPNDMIRDIAHCVAHSDRDRGYAYSHIEGFVENFVEVAQRGGNLHVRPIFEKDELISKLTQDLKGIGLDVEQDDIKQHYTIIENALRDILVDTSVQLRHPKVASCAFQEGAPDGAPILAFVVYTQGLSSGPVLAVPGNVAIACPVFS
jgi:hypothetical protein